MEKSPNSSFISVLQKNIFENLIKIQKENSKSAAGIGDNRLSIPLNSKQTTQKSPKNSKSENLTPEKSERSYNYSVISPKSSETHKNSSPKNFFKHLQTTISDVKEKSLKPSKTMLRKFPAPISPCSELESDSSYSPKSASGRNDIFIGSSQITSNPFPASQIPSLGSYGNLMVLYETELKNRQLFESLYKKERKETEKLKTSLEALQSEIEVEKTSSELKINRLLHEVKVMKMANLDLQNKIKQKQRDAEHETYTILRKSATKIAESELETMEKNELLQQFNHLKVEYKEMSKKLLKQADEMFEKNTEIKQLESQKTELFKQLSAAKAQIEELSGFKEHVDYLLDTIHVMKEKLSILSEMYKKNCKPGGDEVQKSIDSIHEIVKLNLQNVRKKKIEFVNKAAGSFLMNHVKNSLVSIIKNK